MQDGRRQRPGLIAILGGGVAGLSAAFYARKNGLPFIVLEARDRCGGNARTLKHTEFLYDTGAHRIHDKDPVATAEIRSLLDGELEMIHVPSKIYRRGILIDFPFLPLNLMRSLGPAAFLSSGVQVMSGRLKAARRSDDFESFARNKYGDTISERFLLNYSEKLWGVPCRQLSPEVSGRRMNGLTLGTVLIEAFLGRKAGTKHVDGSFYYPRPGIGALAERLVEFCGKERIRTNAPVTRVIHDGVRIMAVETGGGATVQADEFISSLPLPEFIRMMAPRPPDGVLRSASLLRFRDLVLVALFLGCDSVTKAATVYFPDKEFPFTRVYEPKNRSARMAPAGRTSLVAEIPCQRGDEIWNSGDGSLVERTASLLRNIGWLGSGDPIDAEVSRLSHAYPILERESAKNVETVLSYLGRFGNLRLAGRGGRFAYSWIHELMRAGREIVGSYLGGETAP